MTADTIHFHHLILQQSGSYLVSIAAIYSTTLITLIFAAYSFSNLLEENFMIGHLVLLLLFILTPPVQSYVPLFTRVINPLYSLQHRSKLGSPFLLRTLFAFFLLISLIASMFFDSDLSGFLFWQNILGILLLLIFIFYFRMNKINIYIIQLGLVILIAEVSWAAQLSPSTRLFSILLFLSYLIFTLQRKGGTAIDKLSALDLMIIIFTIGGFILSKLGFEFLPWNLIALISSWFGIGFILRRTFYLN